MEEAPTSSEALGPLPVTRYSQLTWCSIQTPDTSTNKSNWPQTGTTVYLQHLGLSTILQKEVEDLYHDGKITNLSYRPYNSHEQSQAAIFLAIHRLDPEA